MTRKHEYAPMTNTPVMRGMQASLDNSIICGDCGDKMRQHMPNESVDLIYMDPPFFSGKNYEVIWKDGAEVRSFTDTDFYTLECKCGKVFPENYKFCPICGAGKYEATERRSTDIEAYLQWLRPKLEECYRALKQTGSIYVHLDHHAVFNAKVMLDEIFVTGGFRTMITWRRCGPKGNAKTFANNSDYILYYTKGSKFIFNTQYGEYGETTVNMFNNDDHDGNGPYMLQAINSPNNNGYRYSLGMGEVQPSRGYRWTEEKMQQMISEGRVCIKHGKVPRQKQYLSDGKGVPFDNVWTDIENVKTPIYPTEKPSALLDRIIKSSSDKGDVVLDPFCGCGTAVMSAQKLKRRWIGIDVSPTSCKLMTARLRKIRYSIGTNDIIDMPHTPDELRTMEPFEFQNLVVTHLGGRQVVRKSGDRGIDGFTFVGDPIQVKRSDKVGANVVRAFTQDVRDVDKTHGIIVAFSYSSGAYEEIEHINAKYGIDIELKTVADLVD